MCCSNITHCLSVQKYWTKFSLWCKQRQFHEHFWCHAYLFILMWPTILCINYVKWLRGICLNGCKQRKYSSRASGITSAHVTGAWVLSEKIWQAGLQKREVRATHTMWNGVLFQPKSPLRCQFMGEAPGSFQLMFPFPVGPRREIVCNFSKHAAKHKWPLALLLPK